MRQRLQSGTLVLAKAGVDALLFAVAMTAAYFLRFGAPFPTNSLEQLVFWLPIVVVVKVAIFAAFGSYGTLWRYASLDDMVRLLQSAAVSSLALLAVWYGRTVKVPQGVVALDLMLTLMLCGAARIAPRLMRERMGTAQSRWLSHVLGRLLPKGLHRGARRILIVGAGDAGESLAREMARNQKLGYQLVAFVDDDPAKKGLHIHGVKVRGTRHDIPRLVEQHEVDEVLIAIPSATAEVIRPIVDICRTTSTKLKILPDLASLVHGAPRMSDVRDLRIEDLLGRPKVELNIDEVSAYLRGKRVLVTGAGGSIGSELCRQILRFRPAEIHLFGRGENSIYAIHQELQPKRGDTRLVEVIGDVINKHKLVEIFRRFQPEIVFHAGADKHVPLMELNPDEAVLNNILGTRNVLETCNQFGVERMVCISTDKAVNPTSIMGCCKRVAEMYVQSGRYRNTIACAVRFGNVLGSRGSVIPMFQAQIERGGPVTVTHKEIRRYFMTIPEAVALVIQAAAMARGGEIFVLDMGEPVLIDDLARRVIRLHGLEPDKDIPVVYVGMRPGEKLNEELFSGREPSQATAHHKIFKVPAPAETTPGLDEKVAKLIRQAVDMDDLAIRHTLREVVPEYQPYLPPEVQSWTAKRQS